MGARLLDNGGMQVWTVQETKLAGRKEIKRLGRSAMMAPGARPSARRRSRRRRAVASIKTLVGCDSGDNESLCMCTVQAGGLTFKVASVYGDVRSKACTGRLLERVLEVARAGEL